jgi:diphosphomevalonate decarboxylase
MMMTSMPYFILMKTKHLTNHQCDLEVSYWDQNVCFTLDAGANVHVLYPENDSAAVLQFIKDELVGFAKMGSTFVTKLKWFKKLN